MPAYVELYIDQGNTFRDTVTLIDDTTNSPINIAGYSVSSQMRRSYYSQNASANITCTITDAANGTIVVSMPSANTSALKAGDYVFDIKIVDVFGIVSRPLGGIISVTPQVTR